MQFSADYLLHRIANKGFWYLKEIILLLTVKQPRAFAFRPMPINIFVNQRPHIIWYLRKYEKQIIGKTIGLFLVVIILVLLIGNWR